MKIKMMKKRARPTIKRGRGHITPADGNIFLDLGFPPAEAAEMLAQADREIAEERRLKLKRMPNPMNGNNAFAVEEGSTNVYADLNYPDAAAMQRKSQLVIGIARTIHEQGLTLEVAAALTGMERLCCTSRKKSI